jgi:protein-S-isoprenylcysteine O-methyltransferase Ste14
MADVRTADVPDNAGVWFPPPLLYAFAVIGGALLNRGWPLEVDDGAVVTIIATILCAGSVALALASVGLFRRAGTTPIPRRPTTALVISGPYRFTRNPMYVSMAGLTAGLGLLLNTWWPMLLLVPVLIIVRVAVIAREEQYLRRRFGDDYVVYTRRVRRWI